MKIDLARLEHELKLIKHVPPVDPKRQDAARLRVIFKQFIARHTDVPDLPILETVGDIERLVPDVRYLVALVRAMKLNL